MRRTLFLGLAGIAMALLAPGQAKALPELQLYLEGATYDTSSETWVVTAPTTPLRLWVIGDVSAKGTISDVNLAIAYGSDLYGKVAFSLAPSTTGGYGGFLDPSTPVAAVYSQEQNGTIPKLSDGSTLPSHGEYG